MVDYRYWNRTEATIWWPWDEMWYTPEWLQLDNPDLKMEPIEDEV